MTAPLVSVLIPCYNAERFLGDTLESVFCQTWPKIEILVVDDGSTDGSLELARSFTSRGVRVIAQENRGQSAALNAAYAAARGEYIQYLDADDVVHPEKIEVQIQRLRGAPPLTVASGAWARFESDIAKATFTKEGVWRDLGPIDWLVESWSGGGMMHVAAWLIPRRVVDAAGPWVESLRWAANIDADFFSRALLASKVCVFCADAKSYYRSVAGSQSRLAARRNLEGSLEVLFRTGEALLARESSPRTHAAFADNLKRFVYSTYPDNPDLVRCAERRIRELGGSSLPFTAGTVTEVCANCIGWKTAKRLRRIAEQMLRTPPRHELQAEGK